MAANPESSEVTTHPARAQITRELVQPPARVYMTLDDQLYIRSRNSLSGVVLRLAGRVLTPDGEIVPFNFEHTPASDRTASIAAFRLAEGFLLSAVVFPSAGAPVRGETFVELGFLRGIGGALDIVDVLAKDYVAEAEPLAFPGSPIRSSIEGRGNMRSITGTNPAAAAEISETVPTDARWKFYSLQALIVTDANVANRLVRAVFDDGTTQFHSGASASPIAASQSVDVVVSNFGDPESIVTVVILVPVRAELFLPAGFRIQTETISLQAGDDWGAPQLLVEEWLQD